MNDAKRPSLLQRLLDKLDYAGNKLPAPATIFVIALGFTWIASALLAPVEFATPPAGL